MFRTEGGTPLWVCGAGPTIILIHGVLVDHRMWAPQVERLSQHYRICCFDMLGHGDAPDPPGARKLEDFVAQTREVVETFSHTGPPILCGFSMGGLVALAYAKGNHDKLSGLIVLNTSYGRSARQIATVKARYAENVRIGVQNAINSAANRWFTEYDYERHPEVVETIFGWMRDGDFAAKRKAHRVLVTSDAEIADQIDVISIPTLIMTGDGDTGSTPEMAFAMGAAIKGSRVEILDSQRHMMPLLDAERVNSLLLDFLTDVAPGYEPLA